MLSSVQARTPEPPGQTGPGLQRLGPDTGGTTLQLVENRMDVREQAHTQLYRCTREPENRARRSQLARKKADRAQSRSLVYTAVSAR